MFKKVLIVLMFSCFLFGWATKAEVEGVKEEAEITTAVESSVGDEDAEKYVPKVIIEAKWGDGPGEFGRVPYPKSVPPVGPRDFYVDNNGKIYVLDAINSRVQIFDVNGVFVKEVKYNEEEVSDSLGGVMDVAADSEGNIYLLATLDFPSRGGVVCCYNAKGRFLGKVILPVELFMPSLEEFKEHGGYWGLYQLLGGLEEFQIKNGDICLVFEDKIYVLATTSMFILDHRGFPTVSRASLELPRNSISDVANRIIDRYKKRKVDFSGEDKDNNFFIRMSRDEVLKFNSEEKLLAKIKINFKVAEYNMGKSLLVSNEGNVYYWTNDKSGLSIYKYSRD